MIPNNYSPMWWSLLDTGKIKELPSTTNNLVKNVVAAKSCPNHGAPKLNLALSHKQPEIAEWSYQAWRA